VNLNQLFAPKVTVVGVHQANYLPWIGYFLKLALCNKWIFLNDVQINKKGPTRRSLKSSFDETIEYLTIPLQAWSDHSLINELKIKQDSKWSAKHVACMNQSYRKNPFFHEIKKWLDLLEKSGPTCTQLTELNQQFIIELAKDFGLTAEMLSSSDYNATGNKDERNSQLVKSVGGHCYLRGIGGSSYSDDQAFHDKGIQIVNLDTVLSVQQLSNEYDLPFLKANILETISLVGTEQIQKWLAQEQAIFVLTNKL